jgi:ribosomal protein S18 acetylase RimI-like enzyme
VAIRIVEVDAVDDALVEAFERLTPQLSKSNPAPSRDELQEIAISPATVLFMAVDDDGRYVGTLTLALFRIPTALRAWIEDVIVDDGVRGQGVGEALNRAALAKAKALGAKTVDLTSRPSREAANRLYQRIGFTQRETNVYRYELEQ